MADWWRTVWETESNSTQQKHRYCLFSNAAVPVLSPFTHCEAGLQEQTPHLYIVFSLEEKSSLLFIMQCALIEEWMEQQEGFWWYRYKGGVGQKAYSERLWRAGQLDQELVWSPSHVLLMVQSVKLQLLVLVLWPTKAVCASILKLRQQPVTVTLTFLVSLPQLLFFP